MAYNFWSSIHTDPVRHEYCLDFGAKYNWAASDGGSFQWAVSANSYSTVVNCESESEARCVSKQYWHLCHIQLSKFVPTFRCYATKHHHLRPRYLPLSISSFRYLDFHFELHHSAYCIAHAHAHIVLLHHMNPVVRPSATSQQHFHRSAMENGAIVSDLDVSHFVE